MLIIQIKHKTISIVLYFFKYFGLSFIVKCVCPLGREPVRVDGVSLAEHEQERPTFSTGITYWSHYFFVRHD